MIVLNDARSSYDLLNQRADIFPSRPRPDWIADQHSATTKRAKLADRDRAYIQLCHDDEAKKLTMALLVDAEHYAKSIEQYVRSTVSHTNSTRRSDPKNDHTHSRGVEITADVNSGNTGKFIMGKLPWLANMRAWAGDFLSDANRRAFGLRRFFYCIPGILKTTPRSRGQLDPIIGHIVPSNHW